jgi:hypothetical protein
LLLLLLRRLLQGPQALLVGEAAVAAAERRCRLHPQLLLAVRPWVLTLACCWLREEAQHLTRLLLLPPPLHGLPADALLLPCPAGLGDPAEEAAVVVAAAWRP